MTASGDGSVAVNTAGGGVVGVIQTGNDAVAVSLPVEALGPVAEVDAPPGLGNLPDFRGRFVGREHELDRLDAVLDEGGGQVVVSAVHGLGGIGKSTLVAYWAATRPHEHAPVWWITADTTLAVEQGLARLATALQPGWGRVLAVEELAERGLQWLATHTGWLLILDNVDNLTTVAPVLARVGAGGRVVLTSRRASGWWTGTTVVRLDVLDPAESLQLLTGLLTAGGPRDEDGAAELCAELGHLPLAIEQAGAYLAQNPFLTLRGYLDLLADHPARMFGQTNVDIDAQSEQTIARIWRVTLDHIAATEPAAVELLRVMAWYGSHTIPLDLCRVPELTPPALGHALGVLAAYSMITPDPVTGTVSIHRLVQAVARTPDPDDPHRDPTATARAHTRAVEALHAVLPDYQDPGTWPAWRVLLPHVDALTSHPTTTSSDDVSTAILTASIGNRTGLFLSGQGLHTDAMSYLHQALTDRERVLGVDHPDTLSSRNNLAGAYGSAGRVGEAIPMYEQTLTDRERVLGVDHPDTLTSRNNLAGAYGSAGRVGEAIPMYEQTLTDRERVLGVDHPNTLTSRNNLANAYESAGRVGEAIPLLERTLTDCERVLGVDHPDTLTSRNNLANAYESAGRVGEAIPMYEQTLTDCERVLGVDHPDTLTSRNNLAGAYRSAGRVGEAIPLLKRTLTDRERLLGVDHPDTLSSRNNLASAYESAGRVGEAIPMYEQTLTDCERLLGVDHPNTVVVRNNLAVARSASR
ncbi:tetratricopeptide repeat protein [Nocardia fluminea]|uniref:tetratricopeptide repeat protein n=1 Tax=Nocardia fluminea TaxID=134984 RepID=UPI00371282D7